MALPFIDFDVETYSEVDLSAVGSYAYARHPSTIAHCATWRMTDGRFYKWNPGIEGTPVSIANVISNGILIGAHNCAFDAEIWRFVMAEKYGWYWPGYDAFIDTMAIGQIYNLPGKLDKAAQFISGMGKDIEGYKLMMKMCKPAAVTKNLKDPRRHHTPENIKRLTKYCANDVKAERRFVSAIPRFSDYEERVWRETWRMNRNGVCIDIDLVTSLRAIANEVQDLYRGQLREITGNLVQAETNRIPLAKFIIEHGAELPLTEKGNPSFAKDTAHLINMDEADGLATKALELYHELNNSSLSKLDKMISCCCEDGRIRGMFRYSGAGQTGRWAGQEVQLQNLPRGILETLREYETALAAVRGGADFQTLEVMYGGNALDVCSTLIRCCLVAADGHQFLVADYSAIEGRVLAWMAKEYHILDAYKAGKRMYAIAASAIFGVPYEQIYDDATGKKLNKSMDAVGKVSELACGYQGSIGAFIKMGGRKLGLTETRIKEIVSAWRDDRKKTVKLWYDLQKAAIKALEFPMTKVKCGPVTFGYDRTDLMMRLPSGRKLYYHKAHLTEKEWPDGGTSPQITYYGVDGQKTGWLSTYGGKLCENATQAIARDILAHATLRAAEEGFKLVMTVHDELVAEEPLLSRDHHSLCEVMEDTPAWAKGIPIVAEGFAGNYYRKG